ncbi:hypothetical protein [Roseateles terrae]|uniref:Uncharacterized protein n=1 Tax=Roseateles terrae TaxID=431060 RepID=A0ABR6GWX1_9BURK|nr:hypothetical protein [Roseateles terrae]MBB3196555.1 hypothetical protein [Roseateles terrae]OWQ84820.1 hypothetical protein CDN98_17275 [Roseateles terrae]
MPPTPADAAGAATQAPLSQREADRLEVHYRTFHDPLPANVQDLAPLVWDLFKVKHWPAGEARFQHLRDIAMTISRSPRLHLPGDEGFRRVAREVAPHMEALLDDDGLFLGRSPGVAAALKEFDQQWTAWLTQSHVESRPVTLIKSVPIHGPFSASTALVAGVTLGAWHPPAGTCLARSAPLTGAASQPLLTLRSEPGGIRMESAPQTQAQLTAADAQDSPSPLELHFFLLQDALDATVKGGGHLQEALDRFNLDAAPEFQLKVGPRLCAPATHAGLQATDRSAALSMAWFDYRLLAVPSELDRLVTSPAAQQRLELCRRLGRDITAREVNLTRKHHTGPMPQLRDWLVAGCAVQVCLEDTQLKQRRGQRFDFKVPVHEVYRRMSPLEQSLMSQVLCGLQAYLPGMRPAQDVMSPPLRHHAGMTYLSMEDGQPMACAVLRDDRHADAADIHDPAASSASGMHPDHQALLANLEAEPLRDWDDESPEGSPVGYSDLPVGRSDELTSRFAAHQIARDERLAQLRHEQSIDAAIHIHPRAPEPSAQRFEELRPTAAPPWLKALVEGEAPDAAMGATGATVDPALVLDRETQALFAPEFSTAVEQLLHDVRTPRRWTDFSADLAPRLLADLAAWPVGRTLDIHDAQTGALMFRFGEPMADRAPVRVTRSPRGDRYATVQGAEVLAIPHGGDAFYAAVLGSMAPQERLSLLKAAGCTESSAQWLGASVLKLREYLARHLDQHREDYRSSIVLHQFLAG